MRQLFAFTTVYKQQLFATSYPIEAWRVKLETMTDRLTNASSNRPTTNMRGHGEISLQTNKDDNERGTISNTIRHEASTTGYSFPLSVVFRQSVVTVELLNALRNHV